MKLKYTLGAILTIPFLPLMYLQGKRIKASVPKLPEAKGVEGQAIFAKSAKPNLKMLAIGESTIAGVGVATHEEGFVGTLAKELAQRLQAQIDWKVYAQSGYTVKSITKRIVPQISEREIDLIVIGIGGNDAFELISPKRWREDSQNLILDLREKFPNSLMVFCNMPPIKEFPAFTSLIRMTIGNLVEILGEELYELSQDFEKVHYHKEVITLSGWMKKHDVKGSTNDFFSDGVHPAKLTYQVWAKDMADEICRVEVCQKALKPWLTNNEDG
ncbi:MAG: SGNH/GDSL hydrolase family protein [Bacteroidia bacterium]